MIKHDNIDVIANTAKWQKNTGNIPEVMPNQCIIVKMEDGSISYNVLAKNYYWGLKTAHPIIEYAVIDKNTINNFLFFGGVIKTRKEMMQALVDGEILSTVQGTELKLIDDYLYCDFKNGDGFIKQGFMIIDVFGVWYRKLKTININGFEIPIPIKVPPDIGTEVFIPDIRVQVCKYVYSENTNQFLDKLIELGMVHLSEESAKLHTKALISITKHF